MIEMMQPHADRLARTTGLAVCIRNAGCPASLELHRLYRTLVDGEDERHGLLQIVDGSGLGYLCPGEFFQRVAPRPVQTPPDAPDLRFALCVSADDAPELTSGGIYAILADPAAERAQRVRVIDDHGRESLHSALRFRRVDVPDELRDELLHAS